MTLSGTFTKAAKKAVMGAVLLSTVFLSACGYPSHQLGQEQGLQGSVAVEQMYDGAAPSNHLTVDGAQLQPKNHYDYDGGALTIRGSVPAQTEINVPNGRLEVTGNVGDKSEISANLPVLTHQQSYTYTTFMMVGKVMIPQVHTGTRTIEDDLAFPDDTHPGVQVNGSIGNKVQVSTNGGIQAGYWGTEFRVQTGYGRTLQQVPRPAG